MLVFLHRVCFSVFRDALAIAQLDPKQQDEDNLNCGIIRVIKAILPLQESNDEIANHSCLVLNPVCIFYRLVRGRRTGTAQTIRRSRLGRGRYDMSDLVTDCGQRSPVWAQGCPGRQGPFRGKGRHGALPSWTSHA